MPWIVRLLEALGVRQPPIPQQLYAKLEQVVRKLEALAK